MQPSAVGGASLTQRHIDRRESRAGDHAVLDAAWGVVQRGTKKPPTAGPSAEDRGNPGDPGPAPGPAPTDMRGRVIEHRVIGNDVMVRITLGAKSGAAPEMEGFLHSGDGQPKMRFKVEDLDVDTSWMVVRGGHLDTLRTMKQVVLNPAKSSASKKVQKSHDQHSGLDDGGIRAAAAHGIAGSGGSLPHLDAIQRAFGAHDVTGVRAHVGGAAREASAAMGAHAYATGNDVAFAEAPSLFLAAHEAAHVVQQRAGVHLSSAVGQEGDTYEQHADAVAARVVAGESAEDLLGTGGAGGGAVQRKETETKPKDRFNPTFMVVNSYHLAFNNQRAGLTRLGAALKTDKIPDSSVIGDLAGAVVGTVIGAVLGPAGTFAATFPVSATGKAIVTKIAAAVTAKAVEVGSATAKEHFNKKKTDPADNFIEKQAVAINKAEHAAIQEFLDVSSDVDPAEGPEALRAMSAGLEREAQFASDREVAYSAGAWARQIAERPSGTGATKGDIEIEAVINPGLAMPLTILSSDWKGLGDETEGVVQQHATARIAELGVPLYVKLRAPHGDTWFRAVDEHQVYVPSSGSVRDWLIHAAFGSNSQRGEDQHVAAAENAARSFAVRLFNMPVAKLAFTK